MKYMGSKLSLLSRGLGETVLREAKTAERFVDLFSGTGQVGWHVAELIEVPVLAVDLQHYSAIWASAVIERDEPLDPQVVFSAWLDPVRALLMDDSEPPLRPLHQVSAIGDVIRARQLCASEDGGPIWRAYGGHYFSPQQAAQFDVLLDNLPDDDWQLRRFCQSLLVVAASRAVAAPGHTAQPFQPTESALPYIAASWQLNPIEIIENQLYRLAPRHALVLGTALVADANEFAVSLTDRDVAFVDPPYSDVQYSRFYHVLETFAKGGCGDVSGVGRYPPMAERPRSAYSIRSRALTSILDLLEILAHNGCRVILTFPYSTASNGINGEELAELARQWYHVKEHVVLSKFSTMGGNGRNRSARQSLSEMVAVLYPA